MDVLKCVCVFFCFFFLNMDTSFMANIIPQIRVCILLTLKTHPFYFWKPLFTKPPFKPIKSSILPFYQFSEFLKPTLSKVWVTNYGQFRLSLLLLLGQQKANLRWACFLHYLKMINNFWKEKKNNARILKQIVWETRPLWEKFSLGSIRSSPGTFKESY